MILEKQEKLDYIGPIMQVIFIEMENGIANESTSRIGVDTQSNSIQVENWQNGDGFEEKDFSL